MGLAPSDDAAVFQLSSEVAVVSTTDFFPPLVDEPSDFGAIAAANACSDVFAMGGRVVLALNVAAFPETLPVSVIEAILAAAAEKVVEAGGVVAGGHTIRSTEPIFGLAVQGVVHPDRVWRKSGARPGDLLVLSKPLGTGLVLAGGVEVEVRDAIRSMRDLNRRSAERLALVRDGAGPNACTDVTGYGLLGHGREMAERSGVVLRFVANDLPAYSGALEAARRGVRTGGDARNRAMTVGCCDLADVSAENQALAFDPQTSGGLLAAVAPDDAADLDAEDWWLVGDVREGPAMVELC